MSNTVFFNAHHSPTGAFASFTLGSKGAKGGFGLELAGPANEDVYIGLEERDEEGLFRALPFYEGTEGDAGKFDVEGLSEVEHIRSITPFGDEEIQRTFSASIDEWAAGDLKFRIVSPPQALPDPSLVDTIDEAAPSILLQLTVDNRKGSRPRRAFLGFRGSDRTVGMRVLEEPGLTGFGQGTSIAIASLDTDLYAGLAWQPEAILVPTSMANLKFMLGNLGLIVGVVQPGEIRTFSFAAGFFRDGTATTGIRTRYLYRRWFDSVEQVLKHALAKTGETIRKAEQFDAKLANLSPERRFMTAQAIRSYLGSTQLLEREDGRPLWVVHEGEYRMMNTFDLTVDQAFFELALNPWTVRNVLDIFVECYSYEDSVRFPGNPKAHPGGIAFTHDMGIANNFSRPGHSGYELAGLHGCFSYMSAEELMNWVLTAGLYVAHTTDRDWVAGHRQTFVACLQSLMNRDHPEEGQRNGVIGLDADRCQGGSEITTYDSLDASLGQARNSLYLAVKGWASYLVLETTLRGLGEDGLADQAAKQVDRARLAIAASADSQGLLPAVIGEGVEARIIPAIEALVYPFAIGISDHRFADLRQVLSTHFEAILRSGLCRFSDGGWRLSSTSRNSWLSKIYLCQYVAERVLGHAPDAKADRAHLDWLLDEENSYFAWSDQMLDGKAVGSRYYPRGVTSILWLAKGDDPLREIGELFSRDHLGAEVSS
jgi:hypothetical protein